ncbi:hypothetical protein Q3G72_008432 [Acer saccharum]|nr:hypothetical protein Q3G72_008432 [Acer saccharum]
MTTRRSRSNSREKEKTSPPKQGKRVVWNLGDEIARIIEKGVALGIVSNSRNKNSTSKNVNKANRVSCGSEKDNSLEWNLEEEVAKVLETGEALGFDFNGNEEEIYEIITDLERKDEAHRGKVEKRRKVKSVIIKHKPVVLFIQESKLNLFDNRVISNIGGSFLTKGVGVEALGSTGGVITLWNKDVVTVKGCISNQCCIILMGILNKVNKEVVFATCMLQMGKMKEMSYGVSFVANNIVYRFHGV